MLRKCCVEKYRLIHFGTAGNVTSFSFPTDDDGCDKWIQALPNTIINVTKCIGVYEKDLPTEYEKIRKKASDGSRNHVPLFEGIAVS